MEKVTVIAKRNNGKVYLFQLLSPCPNGPDVVIDLTPPQAESLAHQLLDKLK